MYSVRVHDGAVAQVVKGQVDGWIQTADKVGIGWFYDQDTGDFTETVNIDLEAARAEASLSRMDFAIAAATAGFVTFEVAEDWAAGNSIPAEVATAIGALPAEEQGPARIVARCKDRIDRNGALMPIITAAFGADDAALDALYGF